MEFLIAFILNWRFCDIIFVFYAYLQILAEWIQSIPNWGNDLRNFNKKWCRKILPKINMFKDEHKVALYQKYCLNN